MATKAGGVPTSERITEAMVMEAITRFRGGERLKDIAKSLGVTPPAMSYHFRKRGLSGAPEAKKAFALCLQCKAKFEYAVCTMPRGKERRYCSQRCSHEHQVGERHASWKDVERVVKDGYVFIRVPSNHPFKHKRKRVAEHVLVAEQMIGRQLEKDEVVHHINGNKADNRPVNLLVCTKSYHIWLHAQMSYLYQQEHFAHL